ncbi:right-handed parallel beta-helix repeat-containing protein [Pelagibius sp. Alg239-R121]|uniref:right-handed parallel beta-helix repeat-containing protein n=1 Tax=Pelagibius sp. Alg239-R121 TaxID=2993448 RepID=UPI0024A6892E|nr:right-handed parallel beta-helix repeat-containing protein [Pelagibius sp. Alg239-R121]
MNSKTSAIAATILTGWMLLTGPIEPAQASNLVTLCAPESSLDNCHYRSFGEAIAALQDGDRLQIEAGEYREGAILTANRVTIVASEGAALRDTAVDGKAALVILGNDNVIEGLECSGIAVPARNGACIRLRGRNLTLRKVYFHDSQQGLLSGGEVGEVVVEDSRFERLGSVGRAHAIYMSGGDHLIVRRSHILSSKDEGHEIKSRARRTTIVDSEIGSGLGRDSRTIDLPNGGEITITNNIIQKGSNSVNPDLIGIALERDVKPHPEGKIIISGNTLIMDRPGRVLHSLVPAEMTGNFIVAGSPLGGNEWYPDRLAAGLPIAPALERVVLDAGSQDDQYKRTSQSEEDAALERTDLSQVDGVLAWRGHALTLTSPEVSVVTLLSSQPGKTASFNDLYSLIEPDKSDTWSSAHDRQTVVLSAIKTLRRKFRNVDNSFTAMTFKPGEGIVWDEKR